MVKKFFAAVLAVVLLMCLALAPAQALPAQAAGEPATVQQAQQLATAGEEAPQEDKISLNWLDIALLITDVLMLVFFAVISWSDIYVLRWCRRKRKENLREREKMEKELEKYDFV